MTALLSVRADDTTPGQFVSDSRRRGLLPVRAHLSGESSSIAKIAIFEGESSWENWDRFGETSGQKFRV